jgi:nucleotide-binding universal stress UspA family protein
MARSGRGVRLETALALDEGVVMKTILIATDGSDPARAAVDTGLGLASDEGAQAIFVHVTSMLDLGTDWDAGADVPPERVPSPEDDPVLSEALELAALHRVPSRAELLIGYPPRQIARLANDVDADVIVVGSRPLGKVKRVFLGSASRELLSLTNRPVLIVSAERIREPVSAGSVAS